MVPDAIQSAVIAPIKRNILSIIKDFLLPLYAILNISPKACPLLLTMKIKTIRLIIKGYPTKIPL
jgi:hypothetical protein